MANAKHTPGPWVQRGEDILCSDGICVVTNGKRSTARLGTHGFKERQEVDAANLRLIAAAPKLLDALKDCIARLAGLDARLCDLTDAYQDCELGEIVRARAVIAEAEGVMR